MSYKRRNSSSSISECETSSKRPRRELQERAERFSSYSGQYDDPDEIESTEHPQVHAFTGQTGAFPGLANDNDEELFYGPAADGIDYLRMVRSEAKGIPGLLVAQPAGGSRGGRGDEEDEGGYWEEDAYIAAPIAKAENNLHDLPSAQSRYYEVLLAQHALVRATLKCVPPLSAIERLTSSQPISFPPESKNARHTWTQCLKTKDPNPTQVACMDENSVFELLRLITKRLRGFLEKDDVGVLRRIGAWTWAVLGKCPDRGELGSDEISELRQLVHKAVDIRNWILKRSRPAVSSKEDESEEEEEEEEEEEDPVEMGGQDDFALDIQAARTRLGTVDRLNESATENAEHILDICDCNAETKSDVELSAARQGKLMVLDMIITIVSEVYGQRDLLELRTAWE